MSALSVRRAAITDAEALSTLAAVTFPLACPPSMPAEDHRAFIAAHLTAAHFDIHLRTPGHLVDVLDDSGVLVGYSLIVCGEPLDAEIAAPLTGPERTGYLSKFYLHPDAQGGGLAPRLMDAAIESARGSGVDGLVLGVNGENTRAQSFYRRMSFDVVGKRTFTVGQRVEHDLVMYRKL